MTKARSKVRLIAMSAIHSLLDKVIDLNSVGAVKQYIRDLEEGIEKIQESRAYASAAVKGAERRQAALEARIATQNDNIDAILTDGKPDNDHLAVKMQAALADWTTELDTAKAEVSESYVIVENYKAVVEQVQGQHDLMVSQLASLEAQDRMAKGKEQAAEALKPFAALTGGAPNVDDLTVRMQQRADVADAKFDQAVGSIQSGQDDVRLALASQEIEERKKRLGLPSGETAALPSGTEQVEVNAH